LPGILLRETTVKLNETWDSEGREPSTLGTWEDELPDLLDPRLQICVTAYFAKHRAELEQLRCSAMARWDEIKKIPQMVESRMFTPGERVDLVFSSTGMESDAMVKGTYTFAGLEEDLIFLVSPKGAFDIRIGPNAPPGRHWLLPSAESIK
jgi:hypothetical protein